jgi:hypothetical protein
MNKYVKPEFFFLNKFKNLKKISLLKRWRYEKDLIKNPSSCDFFSYTPNLYKHRVIQAYELDTLKKNILFQNRENILLNDDFFFYPFIIKKP